MYPYIFSFAHLQKLIFFSLYINVIYKPAWGKRAVGAVNNTFEGLVFFSVAVFTQAFSRMLNMQQGTGTEKDKKIEIAANVFCIIYIVSRLVNIILNIIFISLLFFFFLNEINFNCFTFSLRLVIDLFTYVLV